MQQDTVSLPARDFKKILNEWNPAGNDMAAQVRKELLAWNCDVSMDSKPALIYEVWIEQIHHAILPKGLASSRLAPDVLLRELAANPEKDETLSKTLSASLVEIQQRLGSDESEWKWGNLHKAYFVHPLHVANLNLPPRSRPGDGYTVNATGGPNFSQAHGASYREIIDLNDWDRSVTTNVPGESGVPGDRHYGDLIEGWANGDYHQLPFSRHAVEAAAEERIEFLPGAALP